jgi:hypothetical protein
MLFIRFSYSIFLKNCYIIKYQNSTLKIYIRNISKFIPISIHCWLRISCQQNDKQLVHITVIHRSKNIFSSLESFQTLQLLNTHLVNFKFVLRNNFFTIWWDQFFIIYYKAKHSLICYFHVNMVCIADRRTYKIIRDFKICNVCWFQTD